MTSASPLLARWAGLVLLCIGSGSLAQVRSEPLSSLLQPARATSSASVVAGNDAVLAAEVNAQVARVHADAGAVVERGALLLEIEDRDQRLLLAQAEATASAAEARLALAEQRLTRGRSLGEKSFVSADELLALTTQAQAARADLRAAQAQRAIVARALEKCRIVAPFAAAVVERHAQVGALAAPGTPLLRLVQIDGGEVEARIPAAESAGLAAASAWHFVHQGKRLPLALARMSPVVDAASRTQLARFTFTAEQAPAGSSGQLEWSNPDGWLPAALVVKRDGRLGLFAIDDGVARFVPLPQAQEGRPVPAAGLDATLRVVVEGQQGLVDGQAVSARSD